LSLPFAGEPFDGTPFGTEAGGGAAPSASAADATIAVTAAAVGKGLPYFDATVALTATAVGRSTAVSTATASIAVTAGATGGAMAGVAPVPISIHVPLPVKIGLPIRIDVWADKSGITLPITLGAYPVTVSLPITIDPWVAQAGITLPITIWGAQTTVLTDGFVGWRPKVLLNGTDISSKIIGPIDIEYEEGAASTATCAYLPADGAVDPLLSVGQALTVIFQRLVGGSVTQQNLLFAGIVSDPEWDATDRTIALSATGDLQSKLDRTDKTSIAATVGGTFSEYVFGPAEDLSGWDFSEALLSTQASVVWQDAAGAIRVTPCAAKATADYTLTEADILERAQVVRFGGRMDITNRIYITLGYRHMALRQRNVTFNFAPAVLLTPSTYLSGNEGGWQLPQRTQIESAANSSGWQVQGAITYAPLWPRGTYSTYSDFGNPMMIGFTYTDAVAAELCVGAAWTAARRWKQTWTENYELIVEASESIATVGELATDEAYAVEDPADDETWESDPISGYKSGATLMSNSVDYVYRLDTVRADVATAQAVALAKAQAEILKSHRGTVVSCVTPFDSRLSLADTVAIDTTYLECKGKLRRIRHHLDLDTGDATTEVEIALSRHNGAGLVTSDPLTPPSAPGDPAETAPSRYHRLELHIGGSVTQPLWDDTWDGWVTNLPFDPTFGSATLRGSWDRNRANPWIVGRVYDEGFHVLGPEIASTYADPIDFSDAQTYDVAIPEDPLVLISG
jgi:hypothetical protein